MHIPNESVDVLEPSAQLRVLVSITVDVVQRLEEVVQGSVVGKAFNEGLPPVLVSKTASRIGVQDTHAQVVLNGPDALVSADLLDSTAALLGDVLGVTGIFLGHAQQGFNGLLICETVSKILALNG